MRSAMTTPRAHSSWWISRMLRCRPRAQLPNERDHIEAQLAMGQGPRPFRFGAAEYTIAKTVPPLAAHERHGQSPDAIQSANRALGVVRDMEGGVTRRTCCALHRKAGKCPWDIGWMFVVPWIRSPFRLFEEPAGPGYRKSKLAREPRKYPAVSRELKLFT